MIILASASPRRKELLAGLGVDFEIITADTDETCLLSDPVLYAEERARRKGMAVYELIKETRGEEAALEAVIISADTVVAAEGEILGKPRDEEDAIRMLSLLSGSTHSVVTGIGVISGGVPHISHSSTKVHVAPIPGDELCAYVASGDPMDKAGAYGIQGGFSRWVRGIEGCYFGVVGLPLNALNELYFRAVGKYL